jgi:hypothetical protein
MPDNKDALQNRVVVLNGFTDQEIIAIMNMVKAIYAPEQMEEYTLFVQAAEKLPEATEFGKRLLKVAGAAKQTPESQSVSTGDLIFAKTTANSLQTKLADLIEDMSEDHEYLKNNPPGAAKPGGES